MFCKNIPPLDKQCFILDQSLWFDVSGKEVGNKDHTVAAQIDKVASLLNEAISRFGCLPDVFIITPFKTVKRSLTRKISPLLDALLPEMGQKKIDEWLAEHCGTIHTFQGKEANEVLLVLGCDHQQGMGAARWVGQKPNMINVAVSRAKIRLGVIGSYELWREITHVKLVSEILKKVR
jgi:hypothetical protein